MDASHQMKSLINLRKTPKEFYKYEQLPEFQRLKLIGYYCGTDWASKAFFNYQGFTSRFDHSLIGANQVYYFTHDLTAFMAYATHDIGSACFSHTIDYMNSDYINQESTEEKTKDIILGNQTMMEYFKQDGIDIDKMFEYQEGDSIVNNKRPKLCMDRIDGIIIPALTWLQIINLREAKHLYKDLILCTNEDGKAELTFEHKASVDRIIALNNAINDAIRADYDFYFMDTLAKIVKELIDNKIIAYDDLYKLNEPQLIQIIENYGRNHPDFYSLWYDFQYATEVPKRNKQIKDRVINPLLRLDKTHVIRYNDYRVI